LRVPDNMKIIQVDFIVGFPRSATTLIAKALAEHLDVAVLMETAYFGRYYHEPAGDGTYDKAAVRSIMSQHRRAGDETVYLELGAERRFGSYRAVDSASYASVADSVICNAPVPSDPGALFNYWANLLARREGASRVVEKTPHHLDHVRRMSEHVPGASYVVCSRDQMSFALSYKFQVGPKGRYRREFRGLYHPIGTALNWSRYARAVARLVQDDSVSSLHVRQREVAADSARVLAEVADFLGLPSAPGWLASVPQRENSSFDAGRERPQLHVSEVFWWSLVTARAAPPIGYPAIETPWRAVCSWRTYWSAVTALPWALRLVVRMAKGGDSGGRLSGRGLSHLMKAVSQLRGSREAN